MNWNLFLSLCSGISYAELRDRYVFKRDSQPVVIAIVFHIFIYENTFSLFIFISFRQFSPEMIFPSDHTR